MLRLSGNGNQCKPLPAWRAEAATEQLRRGRRGVRWWRRARYHRTSRRSGAAAVAGAAPRRPRRHGEASSIGLGQRQPDDNVFSDESSALLWKYS